MGESIAVQATPSLLSGQRVVIWGGGVEKNI